MPEVIPNAVRVRLLSLVANQGAVNVLHAQVGGTLVVNQALANSLGAAVKSAWTSRFGALFSGQAALVRVTVRDLRTANQPEFLDTGAQVSGTNVADSLPPQDALCVTLKTAKSGKSFRGRVYIGGWAESENVAGGTASTAASSAAVGFMGDVQAAMTAQQMTLAVASRPSNRKVINETEFFPDGTSEVRKISETSQKAGGVEPVNLIQSRNAAWETQRRRGNGRGGLPTLVSIAEIHI
jgi:hypothetical protein